MRDRKRLFGVLIILILLMSIFPANAFAATHEYDHQYDPICNICGEKRTVDLTRPMVDMFRMYDPNSGEHFYTGSTQERDTLIAAGWNYEGIGFTFPLTTGKPVHRLYEPATGEHFYTMDEAEMNSLLSNGWNYEGVAFNSGFDFEVPQYRLHNPRASRGAYHFTASQNERDYLISLGWEYQGIGWYSCGQMEETPVPAPTPTPTPIPSPEPDMGADLLTLVNSWNPMERDYVPKLATLSDGTQLDERCLADLRALQKACRAAGYEPYICSAYRTWEKQTALYENKVRRVMATGVGEALARELAAMAVARPGTSEHQLGLALDIVDFYYRSLNENQASTGTQKWLMENSWRYGFILRYPAGKSDITGIIYEPWHYRYVGREAAADIYESGLCFEEWLQTR